jgi:hypothetical protein
MAVSFSSRVNILPDVLFRQVGEDGVLVNLKTERYLGLNRTGARMWEALGRTGSIQHAYDDLLREYDVDANSLKEDLLAFIGELVEQQLVEAAPV